MQIRALYELESLLIIVVLLFNEIKGLHYAPTFFDDFS